MIKKKMTVVDSSSSKEESSDSRGEETGAEDDEEATTTAEDDESSAVSTKPMHSWVIVEVESKFVDAAKAVLDHHFDIHDNCGSWCRHDNETAEQWL